MQWHKRVRRDEDGVNLAADVDVVIAVNRGRPGSTAEVASASRVTVVQDARHGPRERPQPDPKERR